MEVWNQTTTSIKFRIELNSSIDKVKSNQWLKKTYQWRFEFQQLTNEGLGQTR